MMLATENCAFDITYDYELNKSGFTLVAKSSSMWRDLITTS